jgi:hypothetical protein
VNAISAVSVFPRRVKVVKAPTETNSGVTDHTNEVKLRRNEDFFIIPDNIENKSDQNKNWLVHR